MLRKLTIGIVLLVPLAACLGQADSKKVDDATNQVFSEIQSKRYDLIYDNAAPEFQGRRRKPSG